MSPETQAAAMDALRRIVRQAFSPPRCRHLRDKLTGKCDICCQACALEQAKAALERAEQESRSASQV